MEPNISQQLILLVNVNKGVKLEAILDKVFEEEIYSFREILSHPNVIEVKLLLIINIKLKLNKSNDAKNKHYNTLKLFSEGNYEKYSSNKNDYLNLSEKSLKKLKLLYFLNLAREKKVIYLFK